MIQKVKMYQAVCDGCGYEFYETCPTENDAIDGVVFFENWQEINGKLYCPDCVEWNEETDSYKPKKTKTHGK